MECSIAKMSGLFCILKIQSGCHHRAKFEQGAYCLMNSEQFGWWTVYILMSYPIGFLSLYSLADSNEIHIKAIYGQYLGPNINSCLFF
jgi:hypothetical protein